MMRTGDKWKEKCCMQQHIHGSKYRPPQRNPTFTAHARCCVPPSRRKGKRILPPRRARGAVSTLNKDLRFCFVAVLVAFSWHFLLILVAERTRCSRSWQRR